MFLLALAVVIAYLNRDVLADTIESARDVSVMHLCFLGLIATTLIFARGALLASTLPGLSVPKAAVADQVALSAAYAIAVGGGPIGVAAKITMFNRWRFTSAAIGASLVATAVVPTFTTWIPAVAVHIPDTFRGNASRVEALAVIVGIVTILFNIGFWLSVLYLKKPIHVIASFSQWTQRTIANAVPKRLKRAQRAVHGFDTDTFVHSTRGDLLLLLRARGMYMFGSAFAVTVTSFAAFLVSLRAFNVNDITLFEALSAFTLLRVVVALSPLPGGVGLAEISSVALLTNYGADESLAVGATLLYRAVVWLLPMIVGGISWWFWSRKNDWLSQDQLAAQVASPECRECHLCHPLTTSCEEWSDSLATSR